MSDVPLEVRQGDTWAFVVNWYNSIPGSSQPNLSSPVDLTGYTATLQVSYATVLLTLTSSPPAGLTVDALNGQVSVRASPAQTLMLPPGGCQWAIEVNNGVDKYTLAAGPLRVLDDVVV